MATTFSQLINIGDCRPLSVSLIIFKLGTNFSVDVLIVNVVGGGEGTQ